MTLLRNRATRLMIIVFLGVLAFAYTINALRVRTQAPRPTSTPTASTYLFPDVVPPVITSMEVSNQRAGKKMSLTKKPGDWLGVDENGQAQQVDLARIPPMLQVLASLRYTDVLDSSEADLTKYGLANGGWFIVKFDAAGRSHTLRIGDVNPSGELSYVQVDGDSHIYLVGSVEMARLVFIVDVPLVTPTP
ncbi:MAG: hypothetical protein U0528_18775 [Anaerolineae bacterium]|nr:hypothetical protein [Anaerolineae bacterium]